MSPLPEELIRALSERYRIARELGRGGMATVYLADDLKHHRQVAVKVLHPELAAVIGPVRFLREIEIAAQLTHPHILTLHDSGAVGSQLYYVTPYVSGGTLRDRLRRERQLPLEDALRLAREIASALGHAHREGLVHRDIKPENILLADGIALVADFGVARVQKADAPLTTVGAAIGTPTYMAPEQVTGNGELDGRADLYALACVLFEMLAGQPPYTGPAESVMHQHLSAKPRPVTDLRPGVPRALAATIAKGLAKVPADRFATAARFAEALATVTAETPPSARLEGESRAVPNNLPRQRTRFIGREREVTECVRALGETRVLTITGIGGCGKTRLALRIAESLLDTFPDAVWFVDLAPLKNADRVTITLAAALDVREEPGAPLLGTIVDRLRPQRALIVLDNCEHVLGPAAELVDALIAATGDLTFIVTSREGLGIEGERLLGLRSLSVPARSTAPDSRSAEESESVRLFVDRAQGLDVRFVLTAANAGLIAEVCRRLDGIPLAIELAAARTKVLTVEDISSRLDDRFRLLTGGSKTALPRHQTLRATLQWSYDLLAADEQRLLRLLSIFSGGWTLEAATQVFGEDADEFAVLERMSRLVDKSLVTMDRETAGESRYTMLETVRQYSQEQLSDVGEGDAARSRHLGYFLALAERVEPLLAGPEQPTWMGRLYLDLENLLAAHAWCDRAPERAVEGLRLAGALRRFWLYLGMAELGRRVTFEALDRPAAKAPTLARAKALYAASGFDFYLGHWHDGLARAEASLRIARDLESIPAICDALRAVGHAHVGLREFSVAQATFEELVGLARDSSDLARLGVAVGGLAESLRAQGEFDRAESLYEESLRLTRSQGDTQNTVIQLGNMAMMAIARGAQDKARALLLEAVSTIGPGLVVMRMALLDILGAWFCDQGEWLRAARCHGAARGELAKLGSPVRDPVDEAVVGPREVRTRAKLGDEAFDAACAEGKSLGAESMLAEAGRWLEEAADTKAFRDPDRKPRAAAHESH